MAQLEVRQKMIPILSAGEVWERKEFDRTIWTDGLMSSIVPMPGFYPGLLICYVNGTRVSIDEFEVVAKDAGHEFFRNDIAHRAFHT